MSRKVGIASMVLVVIFLSANEARAAEPDQWIDVEVGPGTSRSENVGCGFDLILPTTTLLETRLFLNYVHVSKSKWVKMNKEAVWEKKEEWLWQCDGVDPSERFYVIIKVPLGGGGRRGGRGKPRWMSVSDVDLDADTDNNCEHKDSPPVTHRPPDETKDEDESEFAEEVFDDWVGLIIGLNDDNDAGYSYRDYGLGCNYDVDDDVLDAKLKINPMKKGTFYIFAHDSLDLTCPLWIYDDEDEIIYNGRVEEAEKEVTKSLRVETKGEEDVGLVKGVASGYIEASFSPDPRAGAFGWYDKGAERNPDSWGGDFSEDIIRFLILRTDLDVNSDNGFVSSGIEDLNLPSSGEDFNEAKPNAPSPYKFGMVVGVNDDDDDGEGGCDNGWTGIDYEDPGAWNGPDAETIQGDGDIDDLRDGLLRAIGLNDTQRMYLTVFNPVVITITKTNSGGGAVRLFARIKDEAEWVHVGTFIDVKNSYDHVGSRTLWNMLTNPAVNPDKKDVELKIEGLRPGEVELQVKLTLNGNVKIHDDRVKVTVVGVDLDVDSDNNNALDPPDRNLIEDLYEDIEDDPVNRPGKYVGVNDNDDDNDGIPDFADGYDKFDATATVGEAFTPLVLEVFEPIDLTKAKIRFTYAASDPDHVERGGTDPNFTYTVTDDGRLRIWKKKGDEAREKASVADDGDFVPTYDPLHPVALDPADLGLGGTTREVTLYIEGIAPSEGIAKDQIKVEVDPDGDGSAGFVSSDAVRLTIVKVDLDVDSDNNNALDPFDRNLVEDHYEDVKDDPTRPGKFVVVNDDDTDHDFIPDFADGFNRDGASGTAEEQKDDSVAGEAFTPLVIELPAPINWAIAIVKVTYSAADPANVGRTGSSPEYEYSPGSGTMRIWMKDGNQARNMISAKAAIPGDFVPSDTFYASQLGFASGTRVKTFYLEGIAPSSGIAASQIKVDVDPDGEGPAGFVPVAVDAVRVTVIKIDLDATWNSNECTEEVPGTPALLNDDWDGQQKYGASPPAGHREKEPIWDMDYTAAQVAAEDDLMRVRIAVSPADLTGNVVLKVPSGAANIRIWPRATKGTAGEVITIPAGGETYAITTLPKDLYIEGIGLGRAEMTLDYTFGSATYSDKLNIDVVTIEESQGGTRRVINAYDTDITFEVKPNTLVVQYTYLWDLDGDGVRNTGAWESGTARTATVKYSAAASGAGNVQLVKNAANRRKEYNASVKMKGGELKGGLVVARNIRVALDSYEGTALTAAPTTPNQRDTDTSNSCGGWNNNAPIAFDNTPASGAYSQAWYQTNHGDAGYNLRTINNNNRILYSATLAANGMCSFNGSAGTLSIYLCFTGSLIWTNTQTQEDLVASANHEGRHCEQLQQDKTNNPANNVYRLLDVHYGGVTNEYVSFLEAEAHLTELNDANVGWYHAISASQGDIIQFTNRFYSQCVQTHYPALPAGATKTAAKAFLQNLYEDIPWIEMKKSGYDYYVRPPN